MPLDDSIFADYTAAQGDFGAVPGVNVAGFPQPVQAIPQQLPQAAPGIPPIQQAPGLDTLSEVGQHPVFQFYDQWKKSSPEMRKSAERKIALDFPGGPRDMGLPDPTADVAGEATARKEGKEVKQDKGAWGKFMKFIDGNPKFLLDLGASLLAPRRAGVSQASHIATGLQGAVARLDASKAAATKAALEGRKTEAETKKLKATASESPSKIALNLAKAFKATKDATSANLPAANVQLLNSITDALWKTGEGTTFKTIEEARIAGQQMISGKGTPEQMAYYKYMTENAILGATPEQADAMLKNAPSLTNIRQGVEQEEAAKQVQITQAQAIVKQFGGDRDAMAQAIVAQRNVPLTKALQAADNMIAQAGAGITTTPAVPAKPRTLSGDLAALQGAEVSKTEDKKAARVRKRRIQRWAGIIPPAAVLASSRDKAAAKKAMKEIEGEYDSLSDTEKDKVLKIYNKLKAL